MPPFLPTFITIPAVGTAVTFLIFSGIILVIGLVFFISERSHIKLCVISFILFVLCALFGNSDSFAFWESDLLFEGESVYNYLQVAEDERSVRLSTNVLFGVQSIMMKENELTGMYYDYAMAAPMMAGVKEKGAKSTDTADMLILGMGTGTYARQCDRYYDNINIVGVEIDRKITDLSYEYFDALKDVPVYTYDGRAFFADGG